MHAEKRRVLDILCAAFDSNRSVNHIAGPGPGRERRIRALMDYSYEVCRRFGKVFLSADEAACALLLYPDRKRASPQGFLLDLQLVLRCTGLRRLGTTLQREAIIARQHPSEPFTYLWFIAVDPRLQGRGRGTALLGQVLRESAAQARPVYLETSMEHNLSWYREAGFRVFHEADIGYTLYFLRAGG